MSNNRPVTSPGRNTRAYLRRKYDGRQWHEGDKDTQKISHSVVSDILRLEKTGTTTYLHRANPCTANSVNADGQATNVEGPYISDGLS